MVKREEDVTMAEENPGSKNGRDEQMKSLSFAVSNPNNIMSMGSIKEEDFFDLAACMLVILEPDQTLSRINKKSCEILGYKAEEIIGENWFDTFLPEKHREQARAAFMRLINGEFNAVEFYENPILTKDGHERLIRWHNTVLANNQGQVIGSISSGEDITEQRKAEAALRDSERNAFVLLNATSDAVALLDTSFRTILAANETFARRFNMTVEMVLGRRIECFVPPDVFSARYFWGQQVLETGEPVTFVDQRDGLWIESQYYPIKDDQGQIIRLAIFSRDITERYQTEQLLKRREEELRRRSRELEEANTALRVVLKNIEAEKDRLGETINTNLNDAVLPYLDMLRKGRNSDWQMECMNTLETNLKNILAPFLKEISWQHKSLTPAELRVAHLTRDGKSSKEIAELLHVGTGTINTHHNNIRKKLGLTHGKVNLRSFLRSIAL